jgi:hypothetical protein
MFFMKDALPQKCNEIECGIINLEITNQSGSHWVANYRNNDKKYYFDSYGKVPPPKELVNYPGTEDLFYNFNSMALVRERTIATEQPPPVGEVSTNFCG